MWPTYVEIYISTSQGSIKIMCQPYDTLFLGHDVSCEFLHDDSSSYNLE